MRPRETTPRWPGSSATATPASSPTGAASAGTSESACKEIPDATPGGFGEQSGLDNLQSLVLSRDGTSLSTPPATGDAAVARFKRDQDTGKLTYRGCITGESESGPPGGGGTGACKAIPDASSNGEKFRAEGPGIGGA